MTTPNLGDDAPDYDAALPGAETELAPSATETEAHTAWALDDGPEWKPPFWTPAKITAGAVTVAVLAVVVVAGLAGYHLRTPDPVAAPVATPTSSASVTTTATTSPAAPSTDQRKGWGIPANKVPPPTKTVTVQAAPRPLPQPVRDPVVDMSAFDGQFIRNMLAQGWVIWNDEQSVSTAHLACSMLHNGAPFETVASHLATQSQAKIDEGRVFTATAMRTYPNCP